MTSAEKNVRPDNVSCNNDTETQANPVPKDSCSSNARFLSDRRHLLNVFTEKVWDQVFEKVEDPKSLECLSNSSLFFRDLLAPQRVQFLFPTVLEVMGENDPVDKNPISWLIESDICPLKLRSVCLYWNRIIDNMIDNHPYRFYLENDEFRAHLNARWPFKFCQLFDKTPSEDINCYSWLLDHFDGTHGNAKRNPLLGRSINIGFEFLYEYDEEEIMTDFVPAVRDVLQKYGIHIFYFTVSAVDISLSDSLLYSLIREFLQLMPNLKVFRYIRDSGADTSEDDMIELRDHVNKNPLPTIPSLQMLATDDLPIPIFQELIRSNSNIVVQEISKNNFNRGYAMSPVSE